MKKLLGLLVLCIGLLTGCSDADEEAVSQSRATCIEDLKGSRVAVLLGSLQDVDYTPFFGESLMRLSNPVDILTAIETGAADYGLMDTVLVIGANCPARGIEPLFSFGDPGLACVAFRQDNIKMCSDFNTFLAEFKKDPAYNEMVDRWLTDDNASSEIPDVGMPTEGDPIVVGTTIDPPFTFIKDEKWAGYEAEMLCRFGAYCGRPVQLDAYEFSALIPAVVSGKVDALCAFMFRTDERAKQVLFSEPYYSSRTLCAGRSATFESTHKKTVWTRIGDSFTNNLIKENRWKLIVQGLWETLVISFFSIIIGTLLGALICWMGLSKNGFIRGFAKVYVEIMRGVPILVFLMIMFYVVFASSGVTARWVAIVAFAMNFGAYVSEMFKASIKGVDKGQTEAGLAMGFSSTGTFFNFVAPQALKSVIPIFKGEAISLIKSTSIVGYIAIQDLTKMSDLIRSRTFDAFFPLIVVSIIYFLLAWILGKGLDRLSKRI